METEITLLNIQQSIATDLKPNITSSFQIILDEGDYASGVVSQKEVSVEILLFGPKGSQLRKFDSPDMELPFAFVAETTGLYRLDLKIAGETETGTCEITLKERIPLTERLTATPSSEQYKSPRIEALRKELLAGTTTINTFWKTLEKEGTPLIESIPNDERHFLVTFLWRGRPNIQNVYILSSLPLDPNILNRSLTQLDRTDVWYKTLLIPKGARFIYQLSPNDPLSFDISKSQQRMATAQADPLNPHRWFDEPGASKFDYFSRVELPGASPQPWINLRDGVTIGKIEKHTFASQILRNERQLTVCLPHEYNKNAPHSLLILFDAEPYLDVVPTPIILSNLIAAEKIPPTVAVLISCPNRDPDTRRKELMPNPTFVDFLAKELIPWINAHYYIGSEPNQTVIAGSSAGGIAATYAGLLYPEIFGNVLCQSGAFWWSPNFDPSSDRVTFNEAEPNWMAKQFITSPKLPIRFYIDAGLFENEVPTRPGMSILEPSRRMRDILRAKGYEVHYQEFIGGHDYLSWRGTLADGLVTLLGKRA